MPKRKSDTFERDDAAADAGNGAKKVKSAKGPKVSYTSQQKRQIEEFAQVTQGDKTTAAKLLRQANWNMSVAINSYYNNPSSSASNPSRKPLSKVFDTYRTNPKESPDEINIEGTGKLLEDLQIGLEDIGSLVFFEAVQSPQIGVIAREGFVDAFADAHCDSLPKIRNHVLARRAELPADRALLKRVYDHTFGLLLEDRKKAIDLEQAEGFWCVLFSPAGFEWVTPGVNWLDWYMEFLPSKVKVVNKDLWKQTLAFAEASKRDPTLGFWNEEASWPSVIDDFVEWVKKEKKPKDDMEVE